MGPNAARVRSTIARTAAPSLTSARTGIARLPAAWIVATTSAARASLR